MALSASQNSVLSAAEVHAFQQRVPIAVAYETVPLPSRTLPTSDLLNESVILGGAGYGPPVLSQPTPLQRLCSEITEPTTEGKQREHDLVCIPLTNSSWKARWEEMCVVGAPNEVTNTYRFSLRMSSKVSAATTQSAKELEAERWRAGGGFKRGEVNATRSEETRSIIGQAAEWLELDSPIEGIRFDSELALKQEIAYASHLHVSTVILPPPRTASLATEYARAVSNALSASQYVTLAVKLPLGRGQGASETESSSWETWNVIRSLNAYNPRLVLALEITTPLPSQAVVERWKAEPLRMLILPAQTFIANASGYPVLSKGCQSLVKGLFRLKPTIILANIHRGLHTAGGPDAYTQYVRFLERRQDQPTPVEQYAGAYMDYLQAPLQPLMDNLETETYEGFERDPIKYAQYEEAVYEALLDRAGDGPFEIFVVGAGRGPLVAASLKAAQRVNKKVHVVAVEKNANAFVILQERQATEWGPSVELVLSDMRSFRPSVKADLIVSELLGSFGDNELSPECLDGVMRWLKPGGASIPSSYTSYLAPISSSKLHAEVAGPATIDPVKMSEQPYVVMFQQAHILSSNGGRGSHQRIQPCWDFNHPRADVLNDANGLPLTNGHNARTVHLTFHVPEAGILHGFAGYFEAVLYKDIGLSIHPERMDVRQLSWFPIFFPLRDPLYLPAGSELDVHIFRLTDKRRIWYEWAADVFLWLPSPPPSANGDASPQPKDGNSPRAGWSSAFASAISPRLGSSTKGADEAFSGLFRTRIGQTRMHNPLGRSSWVGL